MMKHKPICMVIMLLVIIGGLNWGLVGLGGFMGRDLNVVHMILGSLPTVEWIVYILVGLSAVASAIFFCKSKDCACMKMDDKK